MCRIVLGRGLGVSDVSLGLVRVGWWLGGVFRGLPDLWFSGIGLSTGNIVVFGGFI